MTLLIHTHNPTYNPQIQNRKNQILKLHNSSLKNKLAKHIRLFKKMLSKVLNQKEIVLINAKNLVLNFCKKVKLWKH